MKKTHLLTVLVLVFALVLSACGCKHETWNDADCVNPKTCAECGETEGAALGHTWQAATCETPKTCEICKTTEGEALGHTWTEATCDAARTCETCKTTEGEALGHVWQDATTELPKTCATCAATEGERIVTDSRFTTASTAALQGKWLCEVPFSGEDMGLEGFEADLKMQVILELGNDGTGTMGFGISDEDAFMKAMTDYMVDALYAELEASGLSKEDADEAMISAYGMDVETYATVSLAGAGFSDIFGMMDMNFVYYVEGDELFLGISWDSELSPTKYVLEGDVLTLAEDIADTGAENTVFTRVTE